MKTEPLSEEKELYQRILNNDIVISRISEGITVSDANGHFEIFNVRMQEITGYSEEEANCAKDFNELIHPEFKDRQNILNSLSEITKGTNCHEAETIMLAKDGSKKTLLVSTSLIRYKNQDMFLSVWRDITERKRLQDALQHSETRFRRLFETAQDGILILDAGTGQINEVNKFLIDMLGYSREEFLGKKLWEFGAFMDVDKSKVAFAELQSKGYARYEDLPLKTKDNRLINVEFVSNVYSVDSTEVIQCNIRDITVRRKLEVEREELNNKLEQLALKDSHTGLYNHHYLKDALELNFSRAVRQVGQLSVIMMDLDYFKSINDVYGHLFGDLALKQFAELLTSTVRPYDVVIRYGGEEFIIISPDTDRDGALILAKRILDKMQLSKFGDNTHSFKLKLSLAAVAYPEDDCRNGMDLVNLADQILNKAKESGGNRVLSSLDIRIMTETVRQSTDINFLKDKISKLTKRASQSLIEETLSFAKVLGLKDHYTGEHVEKTSHYAVKISQKLNFSDDKIELIREAAMLHDLGKVGISEYILHKKSKLSREEFEEIKKHPQIGVDIIKPIHSLHPIIPFLLHHHERWDGKGYPDGLEGQRIPLGARIIAIADVYQALVSDRPYRKAYSKRKAMGIVKRSSGTQFDPDIVGFFLKVLQEEG